MVKRPICMLAAVMLLYAIIRILRYHFQLPTFFANYLTDLLFVPAMCLFALAAIRTIRRDHSIIIPWYYVLLQTIVVSAYFEWYLPATCAHEPCYVADAWDVLCYLVGACIYLVLQKHYLSAPDMSKIP